MPTIKSFIFTSTNEHVFEHDLKKKILYSTPKIYLANGDLSKRWYVYFSFRNPATGKLQRQKNIYGIANTYKTKEQRLSLLTAYRKNLLLLLKKGFNPFEDNKELIAQRDEIKKQPVAKKTTTKQQVATTSKKAATKQKGMPIVKAFKFALELKKIEVSERTIKDYGYKATNFANWVKKEHPELKFIHQITRKTILNFLNHIQLKNSARSRNNYRVELGSLFQVLKNNEHVTENYIPSIAVLKSKPKRHKTFSKEMQEKIFIFLEKEDPILLLYIKFVFYNLLRPQEVSRLKVKDVDIKNKTLQFKAKNSSFKTKIIPEILFNDLPDLSKLDPESYLFTPKKIGGFWDAKETYRREYFTNVFRTLVKKEFGLDDQHGLYSFRHTLITKLYREIRKSKSPFAAKSELMVITGHNTITALEKYLRDIDAELPSDYSDLIS